MSLTQYSKEQLKEMSLIEMAFELLDSKKQAVSFKEILDELKSLLDLSDEEIRTKISQFYTDLNIDGRFLALGENRWGLRVWYPIDQIEEEIVAAAKPKKKKKKKATEDEDDLDVAEFDEIEEDLEYDDIEEFEDDVEEEDDELLVDDLDDDLEDEEFEEDDELLKEEKFELEDEELEEDDLELEDEEK